MAPLILPVLRLTTVQFTCLLSSLVLDCDLHENSHVYLEQLLINKSLLNSYEWHLELLTSEVGGNLIKLEK